MMWIPFLFVLLCLDILGEIHINLDPCTVIVDKLILMGSFTPYHISFIQVELYINLDRKFVRYYSLRSMPGVMELDYPILLNQGNVLWSYINFVNNQFVFLPFYYALEVDMSYYIPMPSITNN